MTFVDLDEGLDCGGWKLMDGLSGKRRVTHWPVLFLGDGWWPVCGGGSGRLVWLAGWLSAAFGWHSEALARNGITQSTLVSGASNLGELRRTLKRDGWTRGVHHSSQMEAATFAARFSPGTGTWELSKFTIFKGHSKTQIIYFMGLKRSMLVLLLYAHGLAERKARKVPYL